MLIFNGHNKILFSNKILIIQNIKYDTIIITPNFLFMRQLFNIIAINNTINIKNNIPIEHNKPSERTEIGVGSECFKIKAINKFNNHGIGNLKKKVYFFFLLIYLIYFF